MTTWSSRLRLGLTKNQQTWSWARLITQKGSTSSKQKLVLTTQQKTTFLSTLLSSNSGTISSNFCKKCKWLLQKFKELWLTLIFMPTCTDYTKRKAPFSRLLLTKALGTRQLKRLFLTKLKVTLLQSNISLKLSADVMKSTATLKSLILKILNVNMTPRTLMLSKKCLTNSLRMTTRFREPLKILKLRV